MPTDPLYFLCGLVVIGVAAQWAAAQLRIPAILPLLGLGLLLGPVTGFLEPDALLGDLLLPGVKLAVGLVLFEGGLSLKFSEARRLGIPLLSLVLGGLVVTFAASTWFAHELVGLSWPTAAVLGAILIVTGPTVIKPMLRSARLPARPALLLKWESIINDALGAILAVVLLEVAVHEGEDFPGVLIAGLLLLAAFIGFAAARFLGLALRRGWISDHLKAPVILAGVLGVFGGCEALFHEAGLLAVTVMGVVLANVEGAKVEEIRRFKEDVATVLVALLFLVLSARLEFAQLSALTGGAFLFVLALLFVVRPLAVWTCLSFQGVPWRERLLLGWIAPRGVVAAAVGGALAPRLLEAGYEDAQLLVPILFAVILSTVVLHGLTLGPLAKRLGLASRGDGGLLVVGVSRWVLDFTEAASRIGVEVLLVDSNFRNISRARLRGCESYFANVLDEDDLDELPLERVSRALVATEEDHFNSIASLALARILGSENVFQIPPGKGEGTEHSPSLKGQVVWGPSASFQQLTARAWGAGTTFRTTTLHPEGNDWETFCARWPEATVLLSAVKGRILFPDPDGTPAPDAKLLFLPRPGQSEPLEVQVEPELPEADSEPAEGGARTMSADTPEA